MGTLQMDMIRKVSDKTVLVSMSGGVDSSTAAALLKKEGYRVIGAFLDLWDCTLDTPLPSSSCCSATNRADARNVASLLDIPFQVLNMREAFRKEIIDPFVEGYLKGLTPNPCVRCNERIKFQDRKSVV